MKRTPMPTRTKPIARGEGLRSSSAPKTVTTPKRSQSAYRQQQRAETFPPAIAAVLDERDRCCQRCASTRNLHRHHRRGKAAGGSRNRAHTHCACNGILLCLLCHHWAHVTGRRQAEAEGFIVSQSEDEPGSVGVMRYAATGSGATQWPACDGGWAETAPESREAA